MSTQNKNYELAMAAAREYRETAKRYGSNHARCQEIANDIDGWVGKWQTVDGKQRLVLPEAIRAAMGDQ